MNYLFDRAVALLRGWTLLPEEYNYVVSPIEAARWIDLPMRWSDSDKAYRVNYSDFKPSSDIEQAMVLFKEIRYPTLKRTLNGITCSDSSGHTESGSSEAEAITRCWIMYITNNSYTKE